MARKTNIKRHATEQEIKDMYRQSKNYKVTMRLLAIMNLYNGKTMSDTADFLMISYSSLKSFIRKWNETGLSSLRINNFLEENSINN